MNNCKTFSVVNSFYADLFFTVLPVQHQNGDLPLLTVLGLVLFLAFLVCFPFFIAPYRTIITQQSEASFMDDDNNSGKLQFYSNHRLLSRIIPPCSHFDANHLKSAANGIV